MLSLELFSFFQLSQNTMAPSSTPTKLSKVKIMHAKAAHKQKEMEEAILVAKVEEAKERH